MSLKKPKLLPKLPIAPLVSNLQRGTIEQLTRLLMYQNKYIGRITYLPQSAEEYFRRAIYIPFLDSLISDLQDRLSLDVLNLFQLSVFMPKSEYSNEDIETVKQLATDYTLLLDNTPVSVIVNEYRLWIPQSISNLIVSVATSWETLAANPGPSTMERDLAPISATAKQQATPSCYSFAEPASLQPSRSRSTDAHKKRHPPHQRRSLTPARPKKSPACNTTATAFQCAESSHRATDDVAHPLAPRPAPETSRHCTEPRAVCKIPRDPPTPLPFPHRAPNVTSSHRATDDAAHLTPQRRRRGAILFAERRQETSSAA
ncbi:unnamed protein product [Pieris macdunnoughi]|uniref:Uncharacterized protein n=1 Tax=Pieris macdunnoughi TaxID=345717 RepID=A0A821XRY5_9NEOP|nr:unnamed protein product [Pieris macdunnoughi]